ncbi:MAG: hypothetical protein JW958_10615 [Candidatus Eisenbacteria bacterium]|nr:hypothetical protein [Candidatus Eisenbacteria bacterium]
MPSRRRLIPAAALLLLFALALPAGAETPRVMHYQGTLADTSGALLTGVYDLTFRLYGDSVAAGPVLWEEPRTGVEVEDGLFQVILGRSVAIPDSVIAANDLWLGLTVGADPELAPRRPIGSVFFAMRAGVADSALAVAGGAADDGDWTVNGDDISSAVPGRVGIGTTTPEFKLSLGGDGGIVAAGVFDAGDTLVTSGAGARLIWYPRKAAFRAGHTGGNHWDDANIGIYSIGLGRNTRATGQASAALGWGTTTTGTASFAAGSGLTSAGAFSVTLGRSASARGTADIAIGSFLRAGPAENAMVIGSGLGQTDSLVNDIENSLAIGFGDTTAAIFVGGPSNRVGVKTTSPAAELDVAGKVRADSLQIPTDAVDGHVLTSDATGNATWQPAASGGDDGDWTIDGNDLISNVSGNVAIGTTVPMAKLTLGDDGGIVATGEIAQGDTLGEIDGTRLIWYPRRGAIRAGMGNETVSTDYGYYSAAFGSHHLASGDNSFAFGRSSIASGVGSMAGPWSSEASGPYSCAIGALSQALGQESHAIGHGVRASGYGSMVIGWSDDINNPIDNDVATSLMIGFNDSTAAFFVGGPENRVGVRTSTPDTDFDVAGKAQVDSFQMPTGAVDGYVLTSDASGNSSWQPGGDDGDWTIDGNDLISNVSGNVGIGTSSPPAKLTLDDDGGIIATGTISIGDTVGYIGGSRLIWNPRKSAFRAGTANENYYTDYGLWSAAFGNNNRASGGGSFSFGGNNVASGDYSLAAGVYSEAAGNYSCAIGSHSEVPGHQSMALGSAVTASGAFSFVIGKGYDNYNPLENDVDQSLMIGFGETSPAFFVGGPSNRVGVNTTSPEADLDVTGTVRTNLIQITSGAGDGSVLTSDASGNASWQPVGWTVDSNDLIATVSGDVGIGTATPQAKLDVAGKVRTDSLQIPTGAVDGYVLTSDATGNAKWEIAPAASDGDWNLSGDDLNAAVPGWVGIGISVPVKEGERVTDGGILAKGTYGSGDMLAATGSGARLIWYPRKAAFRAGEAFGSEWDDGNIGSGSVALGRGVEASGDGSITFGTGINAANPLTNDIDNSLLVGFGETDGTFFVGGPDKRVGIKTTAPATDLDVNGTMRVANQGGADGTIILRDSNGGNDRPGIRFENNSLHYITGDDESDEVFNLSSENGKNRSYDAILRVLGSAPNDWGVYTEITHDGTNGRIGTDMGDLVVMPAGEFAVGDSANGRDMTVHGDTIGANIHWNAERRAARIGLNYASEDSMGSYSLAAGRFCSASGDYSFAAGAGSRAATDFGVALGRSCRTTGGGHFTAGEFSEATAGDAVAIGYENEATAQGAYALGGHCVAEGLAAYAIGNYVEVTGDRSLALGYGTWDSPLRNDTDSSLVIGFYSTTPTLFVGGSGQRVGVGTGSPEAKLHVRRDSDTFAHIAHDTCGVYAFEDDGTAISAEADHGTAIHAVSEDGIGVRVITDAGTGVRVTTEQEEALVGYSTEDRALFTHSDNSYAAWFDGSVVVTGTISKAGGSFLIDHPEDPENKLLRHNFVESPENLLIYRGKVKLNGAGEGIVEMPDYFEALTKEDEASIHLTSVGRPFPSGAEWNSGFTSFTVYGDPNRELFWEVLADRDDPVIKQFARPVEEMKTTDDKTCPRGRLLYPEAYGYPESKGRDYEERRALREGR